MTRQHVFKSIVLLCSLILPGAGCSVSPSFDVGTRGGNPNRPVSPGIVLSICDVLNRCNQALAWLHRLRTSQMLKTIPGETGRLGFPPLVPTSKDGETLHPAPGRINEHKSTMDLKTC